MNEQIQLLLKSHLSIYTKQQQILQLIYQFIKDTFPTLLVTYIENDFIEEVYLELHHHKYSKIEFLNNYLKISPNPMFIYTEYLLKSNVINELTVYISLKNLNWQIQLDKLIGRI